MRIIAGQWRGRVLAAPPGQKTRPTAERVRQALFDRLMHAPWGGRALLEGARVLDVFAGTGALGLEALSRGAAHATFMEQDRAALNALHANIAACGAHATVLPGDARRPPKGEGCTLVFLDPPYGQDLLRPTLAALEAAGWLAAEALLLAESAPTDPQPSSDLLTSFTHGAARVDVWRRA